jgi:meiotically up-regulated gene 157 (Mug157) protein
VWPIALAVEGLTAGSSDRALELVRLIESTTAETGHVHEGFDVNDPTRFTRPWFSWADSMFCALAMSLV